MVGRFNERERLIAEKHYDVFEQFLKMKRPYTEEAYDVAVFSFLEAVQLYAEHEELQDDKFSDIVLKHMCAEMSKFLRCENRKDKVKILSLDYIIPKTQVVFGDMIIDETVNVCDEVCEKLSHAFDTGRLSHTYSFNCAAKQSVLEEVV